MNNFQTLSDEKLVKLYQLGHHKAFDCLVERYTIFLKHWLTRFLGRTTLTNDLVQEIFVKAWRHLATFNPAQNFKAWLLVIAKNSAIDYLREKRIIIFGKIVDDLNPADNAIDPMPLASETLEQVDANHHLARLIHQLPASQQAVINARYYRDCTFREIALTLGIPLNTVLTRHHRGIKNLRNLLPEQI